jgi:hypothetical protein
MLFSDGYLTAVSRSFEYLKNFAKEMAVNISYPNHSMLSFEDHVSWVKLYPNSEEKNQMDLTFTKQSRFRMTGNVMLIMHMNCIKQDPSTESY